MSYWNDYLKGRVPDALLWSHTHSREPKTAFHFKSGSDPASPKQAILNVLMIKNTMVMVQNVSVAGAAKICPHPIDADSIAHGGTEKLRWCICRL
jgi:hypothetical protein